METQAGLLVRCSRPSQLAHGWVGCRQQNRGLAQLFNKGKRSVVVMRNENYYYYRTTPRPLSPPIRSRSLCSLVADRILLSRFRG